MHCPPTCINQDWVVEEQNAALISIPVHDAVRAQGGNTDMNMSQDSFCHPLENYRSFPLSIDEMLPFDAQTQRRDASHWFLDDSIQ